MKKSIVVIVALFFGLVSYAQEKKDLIKEIAQLKENVAKMQSKLNTIEEAKKVNLEDELHKFSYAFGVSLGNNLKTVGFDSLIYNSFAVALEDVMKDRSKMTVNEAQQFIQSGIEKKQKEEAEAKSKEGRLFLEENAKRADISTTSSGLQYEILTKGDGAIPAITDKVKVHYHGTFINGDVFDSSVDRGEPISFGVTGVIKGWTEALQLMPIGSKWKIYIPYALAYGEKGRGEIPPYAALVFEVELLDIEKQ